MDHVFLTVENKKELKWNLQTGTNKRTIVSGVHLDGIPASTVEADVSKSTFTEFNIQWFDVVREYVGSQKRICARPALKIMSSSLLVQSRSGQPSWTMK